MTAPALQPALPRGAAASSARDAARVSRAAVRRAGKETGRS
ncbi:hypothetical protein ACMHYB_58715 [Sorangium sp. So ce1128]